LGGRQANTQSSQYGGNDLNDVWSSTNFGASWTQVNAGAVWMPRDSFSWAASATGTMVIFGGASYGGYGGYYGDLWSSTNDGTSWTLVASSTSIGSYCYTAMVFDNSGYLYLIGGQSQLPGNQYDWLAVSVRSINPAAPAVSSQTSHAVAFVTVSPVLMLAIVIFSCLALLL